MMPPGCVNLLSLVSSIDTGTSASDAGGASAICASLSCFFRWYPPIASPPSSPIASPPLSTIVSAGAGVSAGGANGISAVCASSSCFIR